MAVAKSMTKSPLLANMVTNYTEMEEAGSITSHTMQISRELMRRNNSNGSNSRETEANLNINNRGAIISTENIINGPDASASSTPSANNNMNMLYCTSAESSSCSLNNYNHSNYSANQQKQDSINMAKVVEKAKSNISIKIKTNQNDNSSHNQQIKLANLQQQQQQQQKKRLDLKRKLHINVRCNANRDEAQYRTHSPNLICSMCGDEGIVELLVLCIRCTHRYQHTYCSRSYPDIGTEKLTCNWCLHEEKQSQLSSGTKQSIPETATTTANYNYSHRISSSTLIKESSVTITSRSKASTDHQIKRSISTTKAKDESKLGTESDMISAESDAAIKHSKAFEYLLMVAEKIPANDDGKVKKEHTGLANAAVNNGGLRRDNELNHRDNHVISGGILSFGHVPKRQRCSKGISVMKCRKRSLQLSPPRPNYRRYKLLADVLC